MELAQNRASGKIFVILDDTEDKNFLAVTPDGKIKCLERSLFFFGREINHEETQSESLVSDTQLSLYEAYFGETVKN